MNTCLQKFDIGKKNTAAQIEELEIPDVESEFLTSRS
jgi:hypothetical protein